MKTLISLFAAVCALSSAQSTAPWIVNPVVGPVSRGDGGPAAQSLLNAPAGMVADSSGNVYIAESNAGVIRMVQASDGTIRTIAGTGRQSDGVEGNQALQTDLVTPTVLLLNSAGELVFSDTGACRIRKIIADGTVRDVAGTGHCAGASTGGRGSGVGSTAPALETNLGQVNGMTLDSNGRLIFTESDTSLVRYIGTDGVIRNLAGLGGGGFSGDGNLATSAALNGPQGLVYDSSGNLYIADSKNCRIRMVDTDGNISTVAGNGNCPSRTRTFPTGPAVRTSISTVGGMVYDRAANVIIIGSPAMGRLIKFDLGTQQLSSILGNGQVGVPDFTQSPNQFVGNEMNGVALAPGGGYLISATTSFQVYLLANSAVSSFAGRWPGDADILRPTSTCTRPDGTLIVVDTGTERLLSVDPVSGAITRFAGADYPTGYTLGDRGLAVNGTIASPKRVFCAATGEVYLSQSTNIRKIDNNGIITSARASLGNPVGLLIDGSGVLIYADTQYNRVYRYDFTTTKTTVAAGNGISGYSGDGAAATDGQLYYPTELALDPTTGDLFIADIGNRVIRKVAAADGTIQTVVGSTNDYTYSDITGQQGTSVGIGYVTSVTVDGMSNLYFSEADRLTRMDPKGLLTVLAGYSGESDSGQQYFVGEQLYGAGGLSIGLNGLIFFTSDQQASLMAISVPIPASGDASPAAGKRPVH